MANQKQVHVINSIRTLYNNGWTKLRIARELGIDVKTVRRYIRLAEAETDPLVPEDSTSLIPPAGNGSSNSLFPPPGNLGSEPGRRSQCASYAAIIDAMLEKGLSAQGQKGSAEGVRT